MELDELYQMYVNDLYRYLFSLSKDHFTAEDLVHETFYRAYVYLEDSEINEVKPWLFKVAYHSFVDYTRKNKRVILADHKIEEMDGYTPDKAFIEKEGFEHLLRLIHSIPEREKHAILLCDLHQLSYQASAEILNMNLNTLKSHVFRGRKRLQALIQREDYRW